MGVLANYLHPIDEKQSHHLDTPYITDLDIHHEDYPIPHSKDQEALEH